MATRVRLSGTGDDIGGDGTTVSAFVVSATQMFALQYSGELMNLIGGVYADGGIYDGGRRVFSPNNEPPANPLTVMGYF